MYLILDKLFVGMKARPQVVFFKGLARCVR